MGYQELLHEQSDQALEQTAQGSVRVCIPGGHDIKFTDGTQ